MKEYEIDYIIGYLKDKLHHDYLKIVCMSDKVILCYRWKEIIVDVEFNEQYIINNDVIQISRRCEREICNKVLCLMHKEH